MIFSSLIFLFFYLPFLIIGNYAWSNRKWQNVLLFIGSLAFYAWGEKEKVFVMLASILANYIVGKWIHKAGETESKRKWRLAVGVVINLGVLVYFKYAEFFMENLIDAFQLIHVDFHPEIKYEKLPIGISFYTFQSISYLVDVYRKETAPQNSFINLGLYISLFPQLIAGPIVRYSDISQQLDDRVHKLEKFNDGIRRFIVGMGKKMILANNLAYVVDEIYLLPSEEITFGMAWIAALAYAMQIYFDFSGYSDMAIGLGKMFGFNIPENFNFPYMSRSVREYWKRWHISLSNWFRDYLYIPMGGSRIGNTRTYLNLLLVFFVTGLWHGANWNYVAWGLLHGTFILLERAWLDKFLSRFPKIISNFYMLFVIVVAFVWFRIEDLSEAISIQGTMFGFNANATGNYSLNMYTNLYFWCIFTIAIIACFPLKFNNGVFFSGKTKQPVLLTFHSLFYLVVFSLSVMAMVNDTYNPFIYFRF